MVPKPAMWDPNTHRDPFIPGQELKRYNHFFWSEAEQRTLAGVRLQHGMPEPSDGRFWADGTPLTTALEYNGMALSACYQNGQGKLSCLSCHTMHAGEPNFLLRPGMQANEACYACHDEYRGGLTEHTHHTGDSPGSLCYNCHMPHVVYSLLNTHRSHRIEIPSVKVSHETGKPHACNLCHLDKSLGWTREQLSRWSIKPRGESSSPAGGRRHAQPLSREEESISSALLHLALSDARSRVMVAGAFSNPAAQQASGTDWFGPYLTRLLEHERYPAVRYLAHRSLRSAYGEAAAAPFDYLATAPERVAQLRALRARFDTAPIARPLPYLPLTTQGHPDDAALHRLLEKRHDPDLTINE